MKARNLTRNSELASRLEVADTIFARMKGLLGKSGLAEGEGMLIRPCKGIHTFGMKFPIDAAFLDGNNRVIAATRGISPNTITRIYFSAASVIELPAGTLDKTATLPGDQLDIF